MAQARLDEGAQAARSPVPIQSSNSCAPQRGQSISLRALHQPGTTRDPSESGGSQEVSLCNHRHKIMLQQFSSIPHRPAPPLLSEGGSQEQMKAWLSPACNQIPPWGSPAPPARLPPRSGTFPVLPGGLRGAARAQPAPPEGLGAMAAAQTPPGDCGGSGSACGVTARHVTAVSPQPPESPQSHLCHLLRAGLCRSRNSKSFRGKDSKSTSSLLHGLQVAPGDAQLCPLPHCCPRL